MTFLTRTRSLLLLMALVPLLARPAIGWSLVQCLEGAPCAVPAPQATPQGCCHATPALPPRPMPTGDCCVLESAPPVQFVQPAAVPMPRPLLFATFDRPPDLFPALLIAKVREEPTRATPPDRPFCKRGLGGRPPPAHGLPA